MNSAPWAPQAGHGVVDVVDREPFRFGCVLTIDAQETALVELLEHPLAGHEKEP